MKIKQILFAKIGEAVVSVIIVVALILCLSSCSVSSIQQFKEVKIDSCEYIYASTTNGGVTIIHKANCKNHGK